MIGEWISVNERLPDLYEHTDLSLSDDVLVYDSASDKIGIARFVRYEEDGITVWVSYAWVSGDVYIVNVTHWMPLPNKPKA